LYFIKYGKNEDYFKDSWLSFLLILWLLWTPVFFSISKYFAYLYAPVTVPIMFFNGLLVGGFHKQKSTFARLAQFPTVVFHCLLYSFSA
jgi:hypothetical protein